MGCAVSLRSTAAGPREGSGEMTEKLIRALQRGGRLAPRGKGWGVWRGPDLRARCIGTLSEQQVQSLRATGQLSLEDKLRQTMKWCGASDAPRHALAPCPTPAGEPARRARTPLEVALNAIPDSRDQALARAATLRFCADVERAAVGQRITQNWDVSLHVDGVRGGHDGGQLHTAQEAQRRLEQVQRQLGSAHVALLVELLVQQRSVAAICRLRSWRRTEAGRHLADALQALVRAYNLGVSQPR